MQQRPAAISKMEKIPQIFSLLFSPHRFLLLLLPCICVTLCVKGAMDLVADPGPEDSPDVWAMFRHYDELYFRGALVGAGFEVQWGSPRVSGTPSSFGSCCFGKRSNTITLYESMLKNHTDAEVRAALLHLMIHGILYVKHGRKGLGDHGPIFRDWMGAINSCSIEDHLRPLGGYCITITHDFRTKKSCAIQGFLWKCALCGDTLVRATNLGPPSDSCCIENADKDATCGNMLCYWHNHKMKCGGIYVVSKPSKTPGQDKDKDPRGLQRLLTGTSEISKSRGIVQESDSDVLQENSSVTKRNAEGKLLNAKSLASSSSKKVSKRNMPEDSQKAAALPGAPLRKLKLKQESIPSEKHELISLVSCNHAESPGSSLSKKAGMRNMQEDFQAAEATLRKKLKQNSVASEKHKRFSIGSCNDVKSPRSSTSRQAGKMNMPEDFQKAIVLPSAPQKNLKLEQNFVALEKHAKPPVSSTYRRAGKRHGRENVDQSSVLPSAPQKKLKLEQDSVASDKHGVFSLGSCSNEKAPRSSTSRKAGKRHKPDDVEPHVAFEKQGVTKSPGSSTASKEGKLHKPESIQKASVVSAAPSRKLTQDLVTMRKKASVLPQKKLKLEQDLVAMDKHGVFSLKSCGNKKAPRSSTSRKTGKRLNPEDVEPHVAFEKHGVAKSPVSSITSKERKLHNPGDIQKVSVVPAATARKLKQDSVVMEKNELFSLVGCSSVKLLDNFSSKKAQKQREHDEIQKPTVLSAVPKSILKQLNKTHSSVKAGKQHKPEDFQKTTVQPAVPQTTLRRSNGVAPKGQKTKGTTRKFARKEYVVVSVWQNIYESEGSSGSADPLVNKRTERRKRERERLFQRTYSWSRKRSNSGISSIKTQPPEDDLSQQAKPPPPCLDIIVIDAADQVVTQAPRDETQPRAPCLDQVVTQTPGDLSQPPAPCYTAADQVVSLQTADPPGLALYPSSSLGVIYISDDD